MPQDRSRAAFDAWWAFASSRAGLVALFVWAVAEATVWPVVPDFLLAPMAAVNRRRFYLNLAAAATGSALGGSFLALLAYFQPHVALALVGHLPMVSGAQLARAQAILQAAGPLGFAYQPWSGVPFKVWAVEAGRLHLNPALTIPTFILARTLRMSVFTLIARAVGGIRPEWLRDHWLPVAAAYLVVFFLGFWRVMA